MSACAPKARPLVGNPFVVMGAAALLGSLAPRAAYPCLLVLSIWVACHASTRRMAISCLIAFVCAGVLAEGARGRYRRQWSATARTFAGLHRCDLRGRVASSPTARRSLEGGGLDEAFLLSVHAGSCGPRTLSPGTVVRLSRRGAGALARGDDVDFIADLGPLRLFRNAALADPFDAAARQGAVLAGRVLGGEVVRPGAGLGSLIDRARAHVRERIVQTYSPRAAPLGRALVLGESDLDPEDGDAFRKSGLLHLLAVSGTHLVIAVVALVEGLRGLLARVQRLARRWDVARVSSALGVGLSVLYADFAGGSGSAFRAAYMLTLVLGARAVGLRVGGGAALGGSLLIGLALDPLVGSDISFLLSALATAGLIGIGQPLAARLEAGLLGRFPFKPITASLVATWSATVTCAPVLALMDGQMTLAALGANVVAGPLGEVLALPACLLHAVSSIWPPLEWGLSLVGSGALVAVRAIALWSAEQRGLAFVLGMPDAWQCSIIVATFVAFPRLWPSALEVWAWASDAGGRGARKAAAWRLWLLVTLGLLAVTLVLVGHVPSTWHRQHEPPGRLIVTALDVDQGDALVIDFPDGRLGLVDGGGFATGAPETGARVVLPYLRSRGRRAVDLMVLSHAHPDHLLGLVTVAEALPVRELWLVEPQSGGPDVVRLVQAVKRAHGRVRGAAELCPDGAAKEVRQFGGAAVTVFVPCNAQSAWIDSGENDRSLVVRIQHGARAVLLTGDIEREGEARLVQTWPDALHADLLKAPHHGSDTSSSPDLLAAVRPQFSLISCGVRNRFEHPRPSVLERFEALGVRTLRTDRFGSISWLTDGRHIWLRGFVAGPPVTSVGARDQAPSPAAAVAAL